MRYLKAGALLFAVCAVAAGILAFVYRSTEARIAANQAEEKARRLRWVLPACSTVEPRASGGEPYFVGLKDGQVCGYAMETAAKGYGGSIAMLVGVDPQARVTGFSILSHKETPGLGDKATRASFRDQFIGLEASRLALKKDSPTGAVDALAAATITSRAAVKGVRSAVERLAALSAREARP